MDSLLNLEKGLVRVESWLLVTGVIVMLVLGSYNVVYRNVLAPWQRSLATSGPPVETPAPTDTPANVKPAPANSDGFGGGFGDEAQDDDGFAGGFAGGFGDDDSKGDQGEKARAKPAEAEDDAQGFAGGFGSNEDANEAMDDAEEFEDDIEGFGGGFGSPAKKDTADPEDDSGGFAGGFGADPGDGDESADGAVDPTKKADVEMAPAFRAAKPAAPAPPQGGPPEPGSFAAGMIEFIDAIKIDWIDTLLRQLVIIVGLLGAMIATRRRKHINIDAASKLLPMTVRGWTAMAMNVLAAGVSVALAIAGGKLVNISVQYPKELMPFIEEWHMQLMFPIGFGLLALHFVLRALEDLDRNLKGLPPFASGETAELENEAAAQRSAQAGEGT